MSFARVSRRVLFKTFIYAHTHTKYIHHIYHLIAYDPTKKMWVAKYLSDASAQSYKCLKIKQLAKTMSFGVDARDRMYIRAVQRKISFFNTAYFFPPETDFEYVP